MPFNVALSGLNAASSDLEVTANNIANVNTTGFKGSRAEFADVFTVAGLGIGSSAIGSGVRLSDVAQQFGQGDLSYTNNSLDLAVSGEGFFTVRDGSGLSYTRAGAFQVDKDGNVVNAQGQKLQAFPPTATGGFDLSTMGDITLDAGAGPPKATTSATLNLNLDSREANPTVSPFDPTDSNSYNRSTSFTAYDSQGTTHTVNMYYVKTAANTWDAYMYLDGAAAGTPQTLTYDANGALLTPANGQLAYPAQTLTNGANPLTVTVDMSNSTQYGQEFAVTSATQDGYASGRLTGIAIDAKGVVSARFSNGQSKPLGQVALASFANAQGLQQLGNTEWAETFNSGQAIRGAAGAGDFGQIQSGALEASNVDLTAQLVNMIKAQRNYQANAQVISTDNQITQTVINIRNG